ncbi:hypothetical protein P9K31_04290 [Corynebacterium glutamicum]|uniref:hypothetical protein n=1 Tax=Corynebacterium TaxID=1716 RepID=UPI00071F2FCC|nr:MULTISPECIES: hypothetical protein [Corynebacterium]ALP50678.1 hypothetical protein AC079_10905 [Corynebacterium glutamicum]ANR63097.1 hypothetical protein C628_10865 [[Brevibacterium] flavum ZL-1]ANR66103.1 hypothetical protein C627_10760 [Corynebacterium glutamicum ZL-6]ANU34199.1 hypothetical protein BBD29_10700 [Corynebacterium glutamicum]PST75283.1 hypothetical protein I919_10890 [Corynebacterium glutamicum ZL-2]
MADGHPLEFHLVGQADIDLDALVAGASVVAAGQGRDRGNSRADYAEAAAVDIEVIGRSRVVHNAVAVAVAAADVVAAAAGAAAAKPAALPGSGHGSSSTRLDHQ